MAGTQKRIRALQVEERPLAGCLYRHHLGLGRTNPAEHMDVIRVDASIFARAQQKLPRIIIANGPHSPYWKRGAQTGQIHRDIVRRAAAISTEIRDIGQRFLCGPVRYRLVVIDEPAAGTKDPGSGHHHMSNLSTGSLTTMSSSRLRVGWMPQLCSAS